ncbi:MAG: hypothetical protein GF403_07450 [Candidatus Coatesbacteria bacterium]|nr:hypothetical protein [Candidatus Coatesbacteria bacterium]
MPTDTVSLGITFNLMWVVMGLILLAGLLGIIAWFKTGNGSIAFIAIGTVLIGVSLLLQILGVDIPLLLYITWFAAPVLFGVGFVIAIRNG